MAARSGTVIKVSPTNQVSLLQPRDDVMEKPNGVAVMPDGTHRAWRARRELFPSATPTGKLLREKTMPTGQFDALIPLADGSLLVASQGGKNVYKMSASGEITEVAKEIAVPAAIGYDTKRNRLLIPQIAAGQHHHGGPALRPLLNPDLIAVAQLGKVADGEPVAG